ncbi:MAG TPA: hypothetical protein VGO59_04705 [Verrucomicrobiae bacterium]
MNKSKGGDVRRLPTGAFTVDAQGQVISSTVPRAVPAELVEEIGQCVVAVFQGARKANLSFSEMAAQYATFKITAREMRGGAIIFLSPKTPQRVSSS